MFAGNPRVFAGFPGVLAGACVNLRPIRMTTDAEVQGAGPQAQAPPPHGEGVEPARGAGPAWWSSWAPPRTATPLLIEADDREARSGVIAALESLPGVTVQLRRLQSGDYTVAGRCTFERKTIVDFAASVLDGRLFRQAARLTRSGGPAAFLLEGRWSDLAQGAMRREALQGALVSLSVVFALPVLRSVDPQETARLLVYAGQQLSRVAEQTAPMRHGYRPRGERRRRLYVLEGLPGVGPRRAAQLLDRFGTVAAVMQASLEELSALPGVGPTTAGKITQLTQGR